MNRVRKRAGILLVFVLILAAGMTFFLWEFFQKSGQWVTFTGSPHVYQDSSTGTGTVTDRDGVLLLDTRGERTYSQDRLIRESTLHWLGDRQGNIGTRVMSGFVKEMAGFDYLNGVYAYGDNSGQAELTLSARVQSVALQALDGRKGTVAVYNYKTGQILCAVTSPTFDPDNVPDIAGDTQGAYEGVYVNRFLSSSYIPGSIFKIVTTAAALETVEGIKDMEFTCTGVYEYGVDRVTCERSHGKLNLKGALANSCNCAFAQISQLVGAENMTVCVEKYGVVQPLSFDGMVSAAGNYDVSKAAAVELAWSCIGQYTNQINPCRYMAFMGMIAGGGAGAVPYLLESIRVEEDVTYQARTTMLDQAMSPETAALLQEYMRNNVQTVYGDENFPGLTVCAKSGTSQLGGGKTSNAMFAGFVADEAYPLAFVVVVENGGYGSAACVPILSKVLPACQEVLDGN